MQVLYQLDMGQDDADYALEAACSNERFLDDTKQFADELVKGALGNIKKIDKIITDKSIGWSLDRITKVDRAILRMSIFEITENITPASIVINEAVNLAKKFSTSESSKFINGILGGLVNN